MQSAFIGISIIIIVATILAYLSRLIKQPLIPAYILAGVLLGPCFHVLTDMNITATLSEIGIAFLLFIVGLELSIKGMKGMEWVSSIAGFMQITLTFLAGFATAIAIGFNSVSAAYIGIILAFSSTMIVVKILSDKNELNTLHGKLIIGILLIQDLVAVVVLTIVNSADFSLYSVFEALLKGFGALVIAIILGEFVFPKIFKKAAASQELLFMLAIAVCLAFASMFYFAGLPIAIGAFIAGLVLANLPYAFEISARIKSLRNFFATIFFVSLGAMITITEIKLLPILLFSLIVIFIKPLIVLIEYAFFGFHKRTAFLTASSLAQVSEFGFILAAQGLLIGHITSEVFSYTVIIITITIALTAYIMQYDRRIYNYLEKHNLFGFFDKRFIYTKRLETGMGYRPEENKHDIVICGYDRIGHTLGRDLLSKKKKIIVVDYNPDIIKKLTAEKIPCIYGDVSDPETIASLHLNKAKIVVSTIPDFETNNHILRISKHHNQACIVILTADQIEDAMQLYKHAADYVILPHFLGAAHASLILKDTTKDVRSIIKAKIRHMHELEERISLGHEHPRRMHRELKNKF